MSRKTVALLVLVCALVLPGCAVDVTGVDVQATAPGTLELTVAAKQDSVYSSSYVGTGDVLLAVLLPTGSTTPDTFTATGVETTFHRSASYSTALNTDHPAAGKSWFGYVSDDVELSGTSALTAKLAGVVLAPGSTPTGQVTVRMGGRGADRSAETVNCTGESTECSGDTMTAPYALTTPSATIQSPVEDARYVVGEEVAADFECANATTCQGDVEDGANIDTATPGEHVFTVTAGDGYSETAATVRYGVVAAADALTVNTADSATDQPGCTPAHCNLHEAITASNATPDTTELIRFRIPGAGPHTISPPSASGGLPEITDEVTIDGYTQPGATAPTASTPASLRIELAPSGIVPVGLDVAAGADGTLIRGLAVRGFGINVRTNSQSRLVGSYLGRRADGTLAATPGNTSLELNDGASVGGPLPRERVVIAASDRSVFARSGTGTMKITNTLIGTSPDGTALSGDPNIGVELGNAPLEIADTVIAGRAYAVVSIGALQMTSTSVGQRPGGAALGNALVGVQLGFGSASITGSRITARQAILAAANVTATLTDNTFTGLPGTANHHGISLRSPARGRVARNVITGFTGMPIDRGADNVPTPNDAGETDGITNHPVLSQARQTKSGGVVRVGLHALPDTEYRIDVYDNGAASGQAERHVGTMTVRSDAGGNVADQLTGLRDISDRFLRATAEPTSGGGVSELSPALEEGLAPEIGTVGVGTPTESVPVQLQIDMNDLSSDQMTLQVDCEDDGTYDPGMGYGPTDDAAFSFASCTYDTPGTKTMRLRVSDDDGATETTKTFDVNDVATWATLSGPTSVDEGATVTYSYTAGPGAVSVTEETCGSGATYVDTEAERSFQCTFPDGPASTDIAVTVEDEGDDATSTASVGVANVAPAVSVDGFTDAAQGDVRTYTYTVADAGDDAIDAVTESCGPGATYVDTAADDSFQCRWTTWSADWQTVTVEATDADGATGTGTHDVMVTNAAPVVTLSGENAVDQGETATYTYTASDPGDDPLGAPVESCGTGATYVDTAAAGSFDCTFTDRAGSTVSVAVGDGDKTGTDDLAVGVANVAPTVTLTGDGSGAQGVTKTYTYTATDPGSETLGAPVESCGTGATYVDTAAAGSFDCTLRSRAGTTVSVSVGDGAATGADTLAVTIANAAPTAGDDAYSTPYGTALTVAAPGVLGNDADAGDDALTAEAGTEPANGTLTRSAAGGFTYTPKAGFSGTDTFTYTAGDDDRSSAPATVTITVGAGPAAPVTEQPPASSPAPPASVPAPAVSPTPSLPPAGFAAASPNVRIAGVSRVDRKGVVQLRLENRNAFGLRAAVRLSAARRTLGTKSAPLAAGKVTVVRVRLDRATRRAVHRGTAVRASVVAVVTDAADATRTVRGGVTLRQARAPRR